MTTHFTRRGLLASAAAIGAARLLHPHVAAAAGANSLIAAQRTIEVSGRAASVFSLKAGSGGAGLVLDAGQRFAVTLDNQIGEDTIIHWHGQTPDAAQDGVVETGYADAIGDGRSRGYDFAPRPGTHWMHSHHGLQEQNLLAAPLIVRSRADAVADRQEVVVMLHDFSFRPPAEILAGLTGSMGQAMSGHTMPGMGGQMAGMGATTGHDMMSMGGMGGAGAMHLNDVAYDAYLANDRMLDDPEVVRTEAGAKVLLRIINAATSTAFWIDLGSVTGSLVAVDGNPIEPVETTRIPLAQAQRADVLVTVPAGGVVPVLALCEGDRARTGIILAAMGAAVPKIATMADTEAPAVDLSLEANLAASVPLAAKPAAVVHRLALTGSMMPYLWSIDGRSWQERVPLHVLPGERIMIEMINHSMMAHPMHLHGHHFQVVAINGRPLSGALRDTVLVPPMESVAIAFDADNPGRWLMHCHNLYHMATGMMTEVTYEV